MDMNSYFILSYFSIKWEKEWWEFNFNSIVKCDMCVWIQWLIFWYFLFYERATRVFQFYRHFIQFHSLLVIDMALFKITTIKSLKIIDHHLNAAVENEWKNCNWQMIFKELKFHFVFNYFRCTEKIQFLLHKKNLTTIRRNLLHLKVVIFMRFSGACISFCHEQTQFSDIHKLIDGK